MLSIDLSGLQEFDVVISRFGQGINLRFSSYADFEKYADSLVVLKTIGCSVFVFKNRRNPIADISISVIASDPIAVAERIALTFEGAGLRVQRLISDPQSIDKSLSLLFSPLSWVKAMPNVSICKTFDCPFWSDGVRSESGSIGGYGCKKYEVAPHCLASNVKGVDSTQYELFYDDGSSLNVKTLIALAISHLLFRQMDDNDAREIAAHRRAQGWYK